MTLHLLVLKSKADLLDFSVIGIDLNIGFDIDAL